MLESEKNLNVNKKELVAKKLITAVIVSGAIGVLPLMAQKNCRANLKIRHLGNLTTENG